MLRTEKAELYKRGVAARKAERLRKKEILQLQKANLIVPLGLLDPIPDPEKQVEQAEQAEQTGQAEDDGFIRFEDTDSKDTIDTNDDVEFGLY
jgi:hypothetical protein